MLMSSAQNVGNTEYLTLEALASYAAVESLKEINRQSPAVFPTVSVKVSKPFALVFASASEVEISRTISDYPTHFTTNDKMQVPFPHDQVLFSFDFFYPGWCRE